MTGSVSARGVVQQSDFDFTIQQGLMWLNPYAVDDLPGFFMDRVQFGYNTHWCETIDALNEQIGATNQNPDLRADLILVGYPFTETRHDYPIYAFDKPDFARLPPQAQLTHACTGYHTLTAMMGSDYVKHNVDEITAAVTSGYTQAREINFCPYVWKSPTYHLTPSTGVPDILIQGNGPRGKHTWMVEAEALGQILNGEPRYFPDRAPLVAAL